MAKNRLVSLCTSWSLRYPPCLISLITNKLAANSVTIADFIVIPTCFFSRREVEKWSTPLHTVFLLFAEGLSDLFSFAKLMIFDELELQGSMGLKTTPSRFETKLVLYSTLTQFFFSRLFDSVNENLLIGDTRMKETIGIRHVWICLCRLYIPRILFANQYRHITRRT